MYIWSPIICQPLQRLVPTYQKTVVFATFDISSGQLSYVWHFGPHGLQHARPPCQSLTPRVYSNSCPLSPWCHPTISSSGVPFSSCLQSFPASGSFPVSQFFASGGEGLEFQLQHQSFQWIFRTDFVYDGLVGSPCSPTDSQESSPTPQFKSINSSALSYLYRPFSHPYMTTGKTIALTRWTFVGKVISLRFNVLSRLLIIFLPKASIF